MCFLLSDEPHGPLLLTIEPYQDQASGFPVTELDGKVTWVGTLQLHTPKVGCCYCLFGVSGVGGGGEGGGKEIKGG